MMNKFKSDKERILKKQKMIKCIHCSQYTHKGNFCEQCGYKLATINNFKGWEHLDRVSYRGLLKARLAVWITKVNCTNKNEYEVLQVLYDQLDDEINERRLENDCFN